MISFSVVASPSSSFSTSTRVALSPSWRFFSSVFEIRSIFQPVSRAARRAFWPPLPIASESWSSATTTCMRLSASCSFTSMTRAGDSARDTNTVASWDQGTMSMRSPPSSRTMLCTREPLSPTHEPTASTRGSVEYTEIFERAPASRATALISTMLSAISGTSLSNRRRRKSGWVRDRITCGPLADLSTLITTART